MDLLSLPLGIRRRRVQRLARGLALVRRERAPFVAVMAARSVVCAVICSFAFVACSPASLVDTQSPSTVIDPTLVQTAAGAAALRSNALIRMMSAVGSGVGANVIEMSGTLTDELQNPYNQFSGDGRNVLTANVGINQTGFGYDAIQYARVTTRQARQALQLFASNTPTVPRAWQGEMYALEGYTIVWLAELYCSGIPLSESSLLGAQVPTRGFTTEELLTRAIAVFDTAMAAASDSARFVNLARIGKARALLDLGRFADVDSVVQTVPTNFLYLLASTLSSDATFDIPYVQVPAGLLRVQDHEGGNGLVWSADPRTGVVTVSSQTGAMLWPAKYNVDPTSGIPTPLTVFSGVPFRLADGLEARLIQAEAALARNDASWLTTLNTLRATCIGTAPCAPIAGLTSASLPALTDPGTATSRLDTLMKERAMWLYLTGHREGDLRRLAHVYNRDPQTLWPTGIISDPAYPSMFPFPGNANGTPYGPDMVYGPDVKEHLNNSLYGGCYDTNP